MYIVFSSWDRWIVHNHNTILLFSCSFSFLYKTDIYVQLSVYVDKLQIIFSSIKKTIEVPSIIYMFRCQKNFLWKNCYSNALQ